MKLLPKNNSSVLNNSQSNSEIQSTLRTSYNERNSNQNDYPRTSSSQQKIQTGKIRRTNQYTNPIEPSLQSPSTSIQYYNAQYTDRNTTNSSTNKYNLPSSYRVFDTTLQDSNDPFDKKQKMSLLKFQPDTWARMINRTSGEKSICNKQPWFSNSKTYQSTVFPSKEQSNSNTERRLAK